MKISQTNYGMTVNVPLDYPAAVQRVREELSKEGFGVLTEIDVQKTLKEKLDVSFRPYVILGACNPPLAHQALSAEREIGLLLPCNIVVYAGDKAGTSTVAAIDPMLQMERVKQPKLKPIATDVRARLERVLQRVAG